MNKATIFDVAHAAGVSNATVSRALNEPDKVQPETRKKVLAAAKELGYKANVFAKGLASSKSTQVAVIVPDLARASIAETVKGISEVAKIYGYSMILYTTPTKTAKETITDLVSMSVDGILYLNDEISEENFMMLKELKEDYNIPIVLVNAVYYKDDSFLSVSIDHDGASYEVTKALIREGRTKIALFSTKKKYPVNELKEMGYVKAMKEFGLEPKICYTNGNLETNKSDIEQFLESNDVDGVIGVRDSIAISVMNYLQDQGKRVPEDISIYGFQNTRYTQLCRPALSTVNIPIYDIGVRAMKMLTAEMRGEVSEYRGQVILEHSIIRRSTTK